MKTVAEARKEHAAKVAELSVDARKIQGLAFVLLGKVSTLDDSVIRHRLKADITATTHSMENFVERLNDLSYYLI